MKRFLGTMLIACLAFAGCKTVYNAHRAKPVKLGKEGTIVFVRPTKYSIFGNRSIRDYVEITYEQFGPNVADLPQVKVGLRNRGGQHFWDTVGPDYELSVKTGFFSEAVGAQGGGTMTAPVYETNWQTVKMLRGATAHYEASCPVETATHYRVTISELLR